VPATCHKDTTMSDHH